MTVAHTPGLHQRATVYTNDGTGHMTVKALEGIACRFVNIRGGATGDERAELRDMRNLMWDPDVEIPARCQIEDQDGVRWNPVQSTQASIRGPRNTVIYRRMDLVRVGETR